VVTEQTRSPSRSLAGDAASLAFGSLLSQGAILLTISAVARLVPKSDVGTYQQLSLVYWFTAPLLLGGIPAALMYFLPRARDRQELHDWIIRAYLLLAISGLVAAILTVLVRYPLASLMNNPQLAPALVLYAPYICFAFLIAAASAVLVATGRARAAAAVNASVGVCTLVGVVAAALIAPNARALAAGLSVAGGLAAVGTFVIVARSLRVVPRWPSSPATSWMPLLSFGLPLALGGLTARIGYQFDQVVVGANFPPAEFAVYALGAIELPLSLLMQQAVTNVLAPALATRWKEGDVDGMVALWREALRKMTLVVAPMFTYLMVEAADVIHIVYGPRYSESATIFRIYLLFLPLRIATWGLIPQAVGRTRINLVAGWIILPTNVIIALGLVGPLGLKGPAFAAPAAAFVATIYYLVRIRRILSTPIRDLLPLRHGILCFALSACIAAAVIPMQWLDMPA
jgi:O-antigen/teichoic acid export membrane protein